MSENKTIVQRKLVLEVKGFSKERLAALGPGVSIKSDVFTIIVNGKSTEWILELFPKSFKEGHMSLNLNPKKTDLSNIEACYRFGVHNKKDNYISEKKMNTDWIVASSQFISYADLFDPTNDYIADDGKLTIFCELTITTGGHNEEPVAKKFKGLVSDYSKMFQKEKLKNCELNMSGGVLKCHKFVLAARSDIFDNMFSTDMAEAKDNKVDIEDIELETMTQFVRFCYGLEVEGLKEIAYKLIYAAEKYHIDELKQVCFDSLGKNLNRETVLESVAIADRFTGSSELFEECVDVIVNDFHDLVGTPEWMQLRPETALNLLQRVILRHKSMIEMYSSKDL